MSCVAGFQPARAAKRSMMSSAVMAISWWRGTTGLFGRGGGTGGVGIGRWFGRNLLEDGVRVGVSLEPCLGRSAVGGDVAELTVDDEDGSGRGLLDDREVQLAVDVEDRVDGDASGDASSTVVGREREEGRAAGIDRALDEETARVALLP